MVALASCFTVDVSRVGAHVAQLAEHVLGKDEVTRSIRVVGSRPSLLVLPPFERAADQHL